MLPGQKVCLYAILGDKFDIPTKKNNTLKEVDTNVSIRVLLCFIRLLTRTLMNEIFTSLLFFA